MVERSFKALFGAVIGVTRVANSEIEPGTRMSEVRRYLRIERRTPSPTSFIAVQIGRKSRSKNNRSVI